MRIRTFTATAVLAIAAVSITAGTAQAAPTTIAAPASIQSAQQGVDWTVNRDGHRVIVQTASGTLATEGNRLVVRNDQGVVVESVPLALAVDGAVHPVAAQVSGNTAVLTADTDPAVAKPVPNYSGLHDVDLPAATLAVQPPIMLTSAIGGFLGAATGLVGGCVLGAVVGGVVSAPAALLFGAGPLAGCVGGALMLGAGAGLAGTAIGGLGSAVANAPQFMQLLNQPPAPKK
ncbi:hypothetical protein [Rhodococcus opacus]|uniref:DUF8020 domain-containing protein n=1 Tax=Rhodococcus opacus TaxID=37919 RepID=A0A2S8IVY7_RHOOP|nr:hypothetical protein [Rhodococcus opacus]PQP18974.1 hypothetical protein C5613_31180 [Rhodococcus opacus]